MVCGNRLKTKYVRFLIRYHLLILISILIMTSGCLIYLVKNYHQFNSKHLLGGFQAHGTTLSDDYRNFVALLRETQTTHLYPFSNDNKISSSKPYANYQPEINPCVKQYHHSQCPIVPYVELTFEFHRNESFSTRNISMMKNIWKLEEKLRRGFSNCSCETSFCCQVIGPVGLLLTNNTCNEITDELYDKIFQQWQTCQSSCSNKDLENYLSKFSSSRRFSIYLSLEIYREKISDLYESFVNDVDQNDFHFVAIHIKDGEEKDFLFVYLLKKNCWWILLTFICYLFCLIIFVKNFFLLFTIFLHFLLSTSMALIIYRLCLHLPWTVLNVTSLILYLIILLIDSFLWYACWFNNNHRRDDCPIQRIIENLLTQAFFYLMPKNLTAIIALVITYSNQIIALQCFTVLSLFLIGFSSLISFILYPVSFVCILRYQSLIPTLEHCSIRCLTNAISCFTDRTIPYLIVRLKSLWLTFLTLIFALAMIIVFQWPKLEFDVCRMTFDSFPNRFSTKFSIESLKTLDLDISYYIGSAWEMSNEAFIPLEDIRTVKYNTEDDVSSPPNNFKKFSHVLRTNLTEFEHFCSEWRRNSIVKRETKYKHYHRHISTEMFTNELNESSSLISLRSSSNTNEHLTILSFPCFADLSRHPMEISSTSQAKFSPIVAKHFSSNFNCYSNCLSNQSEIPDDCIRCLNDLFYLSTPINDRFILKNGLRYLNDANNPRYLLQTISYRWNIQTNLNNIVEWKNLLFRLRTNFISKFYSNTFAHLKFWWTTESFGTFALIEQLQKEKFLLITVKFVIILLFLILFTGVLGLFVTLTTLFNFFTCLATLTLFNYSITVENTSYFVIVLVLCSQYSVLYSISYKLAPTFFFQRENRTMYSLQQLCTTLFHVTFSIVLLSSPCLFSSLPYLFKSALVYIISAVISLIYSTFFLQSLLCLIGPAGHSCCLTPCRLSLTPNFTLHIRKHPKKDGSLRSASTSSGPSANNGSAGSRRHRHLSHPRMSTSSYFASSYFSQIFTSSTYFESDCGGLNDSLTIASRRRESSRSHQPSHVMKRGSLLTGELIELYTPRASLAPHAHNHRYSRQTSVPRGGTATTSNNSARPLYVSSSISPYSQLSIHSQIPSRQRSPSPQVFHPSRSPSPRPPFTSQLTSPSSLRPCYSAPRLHVPLHRMQTTQGFPIYSDRTSTLVEESSKPERPVQSHRKTVVIMQRQDAISCSDEIEPMLNPTPPTLTAAARRNMLKTTMEGEGGPIWLKRSSSS